MAPTLFLRVCRLCDQRHTAIPERRTRQQHRHCASHRWLQHSVCGLKRLDVLRADCGARHTTTPHQGVHQRAASADSSDLPLQISAQTRHTTSARPMSGPNVATSLPNTPKNARARHQKYLRTRPTNATPPDGADNSSSDVRNTRKHSRSDKKVCQMPRCHVAGPCPHALRSHLRHGFPSRSLRNRSLRCFPD